MSPIEYRIEHVELDDAAHAKPIETQLVEQFNAWAREGWRVANVDLTVHPTYGPRARTVLLEREAAARSMNL